MRLITLLATAAVVVSPVFAQQSQQRSSNPDGVQIQGNTEIKANQKDVNAVAEGEGNTATNVAGGIKGTTQIQGNTKITASQKNANAAASGKDNRASNEVGVIGGQ